jgi:pimeloyl-ACP methyl ester carboxylesterase
MLLCIQPTLVAGLCHKNMVRITHSIESHHILMLIQNRNTTCRPPVLLQHGLLESSAVFVDNGPGRSLAFALADAGFDVWMSNTWVSRPSGWTGCTSIA